MRISPSINPDCNDVVEFTDSCLSLTPPLLRISSKKPVREAGLFSFRWLDRVLPCGLHVTTANFRAWPADSHLVDRHKPGTCR